MIILVGKGLGFQNQYQINNKIKDFINVEHQFFFEFAINLPQKVLINVEQHNQTKRREQKISDKDNDQLFDYPVRMVLVNKSQSINEKLMAVNVTNSFKKSLSKKEGTTLDTYTTEMKEQDEGISSIKAPIDMVGSSSKQGHKNLNKFLHKKVKQG